MATIYHTLVKGYLQIWLWSFFWQVSSKFVSEVYDQKQTIKYYSNNFFLVAVHNSRIFDYLFRLKENPALPVFTFKFHNRFF